MPEPAPPGLRSRAVFTASRLAQYTLLFSSGAAGLINEVCWSRALGLFDGHGERATAVTLALFFGGMATGCWFAGLGTARGVRPLRAYALCEAGVAALSLGMALFPASRAQGSSLAGGIFLSAIGMGASLPFAIQAVANGGGSSARAYAWHLTGATAGSLGTTFVLIERVGVWHATYIAVALSAACALAGWRMALHEVPSAALVVPSTLHVGLAAAWCGAMTLALQVLVLRLFALTFHNSTYTFGLTIGVFIVCLAMGSRGVSRPLARHARQGVTLARRGAWLAALGVLSIAPIFALITGFGLLRAPSFALYVLLAGGLVLSVLALPVVAAGTLLPALWSASQGRAGQAVGSLGAANSLGSAAGALFATFVLLPKLGLLAALSAIAAGYAALGLWLSGVTRSSGLLLLGLLATALVLRTPGPATPEGYALLQRWQSPYGWIDLLRRRDDLSLSARLDLHYQLGASADRARHRVMGTLPLALHPAPERALFVGLATGMTASAALSVKSLAQIEVVELIPEVVLLARHFAAYNDNLLQDPRVRVTVEDGRSFVAQGSARYDVVVADLFVPWHSHAGYLYTVEHFRAVDARLTPSGVFAQWLPLWQLGEEELELVGESLAASFPHTSVWLVDDDPQRALLAIVGHRQAPVALPVVLAGARRLGPFGRHARALLNTDEHPLVELRAPRTERNRQLLTDHTLRAYLSRRFGTGAPLARNR